MVVVPYYPISDEVMRADHQAATRPHWPPAWRQNHGAEFGYDEAVISEIANRCKEVESGARNVDHILTGTLLPEMSGEFLSRMAAGQSVSQVQVSIADGGFTYDIV